MEHANLIAGAEFWVGLALVVFIGVLLWLGVHKMAAKGLDAQADKIRGELAEAERLRTEAEALLASIRTQRQEAEKTAADMLANARDEAKRIETEAHARLEEQVKRRGDLAQRKIAQAEAQAAAQVKNAAADLAADLAAGVFAARAASQTSDPLVDRAVSELPAKLS